MDDVGRKPSRLHFFRQCFVTLSVSLNVVGHGAVIGFSAILIPNLRKPDSHIHATPAQESYLASIIGVALIFGNFSIMPLMDSIGRKKSHLLTIFPILIGWFLIIIADSVPALIAARLLQGVSMGMLGPLGSIVIAETSDPKNRGAFLTCISLSLSIGVLFCHMIGTYITWQYLSLTCSFITFTSLLLIIYSPESPPWLISKGRYDEATEVFYWLRGKNFRSEGELESMIKAQQMIRKSSVEGLTLSFCTRLKRNLSYLNRTIRKPEFRKPLFIMFLLYTNFQFAGINVISSYTMDIIRDVIGPDANVRLIMVALDVERLICNIGAVFVMKNFKRRTVLFSSGSICIFAYFAKGSYVYLTQNSLLPDILKGQWLPITLIGIYMFSLTIGISSIPFTISGEIIPLEYRGIGGSLSVLPLSLNFFIAVKSFPVLRSAIGLPFTYAVYAGIVILCLGTLFFWLPETKDRTLQDIENEFRGIRPLDRRASEPLNGPVSPNALMRRCSSIILY